MNKTTGRQAEWERVRESWWCCCCHPPVTACHAGTLKLHGEQLLLSPSTEPTDLYYEWQHHPKCCCMEQSIGSLHQIRCHHMQKEEGGWHGRNKQKPDSHTASALLTDIRPAALYNWQSSVVWHCLTVFINRSLVLFKECNWKNMKPWLLWYFTKSFSLRTRTFYLWYQILHFKTPLQHQYYNIQLLFKSVWKLVLKLQRTRELPKVSILCHVCEHTICITWQQFIYLSFSGRTAQLSQLAFVHVWSDCLTWCAFSTRSFPLLHIWERACRGAVLMWRTHTKLHKHTGTVTELCTPRGSCCHISHFIKPCESHFVWSCYGYLLDPAGPRGKGWVLNVHANMLTVWNI